MIPLELTILIIVINTLAIIERLLRHYKVYEKIYNRIKNKKEKLTNSIKLSNSFSHSLTDDEEKLLKLDFDNTIGDIEELFDIFEDLIFKTPK